MRRVADYRENAKACRELAGRMPPEHHAQLMEMADAWEKIANEREDAIRQAEALPLEPRPYRES
jgi:hypothetical protein